MSNREKLQKQIDEINRLKQMQHGNVEFEGWKGKTKRILAGIFGGEESLQCKDFRKIIYSPSVVVVGSYTDRETPYQRGLEQAKNILSSMIDEIEEPYELGEQKKESLIIDDSEYNIENILNKFHSVVKELKSRYDNRETLDVKDEYDVQDLLHALLRQYFDDIRPEERTPSYAGSSKRTDFLLKNEQIMIEVKKTRSNLKNKEIGEQLIIDIANYKGHPDCKKLFCFVYDPDGYIKNPKGLENDLGNSKELDVKVFIRP